MDLSNSDMGESSDGEAVEQEVQHQILAGLKKVNTRLDVVEAKVAVDRSNGQRRKKKGHKISTVSKHRK